MDTEMQASDNKQQAEKKDLQSAYEELQAKYKELSSRFDALETEKNELDYLYNNLLFFTNEEKQKQFFKSLITAIEHKHARTIGHAERITHYSTHYVMILAEEGILKERYGIKNTDLFLEKVSNVCLLHDIGKIGTPDHILNKPTRLSEWEFNIIKKHPGIAKSILSPIKSIGDIIESIYSHHEKWDGSGYPRGLKGDQIPLIARIITLFDGFDVMTFKRLYRIEEIDPSMALRDLEAKAGKQYDPFLVEVLLRHKEEIINDFQCYLGDLMEIRKILIIDFDRENEPFYRKYLLKSPDKLTREYFDVIFDKVVLVSREQDLEKIFRGIFLTEYKHILINGNSPDINTLEIYDRVTSFIREKKLEIDVDTIVGRKKLAHDYKAYGKSVRIVPGTHLISEYLIAKLKEERQRTQHDRLIEMVKSKMDEIQIAVTKL